MKRTDDLILQNWKIVQRTDRFRFGTDAVLLYDMIDSPCGHTVDLCSGNGAVALMLLAGRKTTSVECVEIQREGCALTEESALLNACRDQMKIHCADLKKIKEILSRNCADTVCVNPPYFKKDSGILPDDPAVAVSRYEIECTLDDVLEAANHLLVENGNFYMVHRTSRKEEIESKIKKYDLYPVEIRHIFSKPERPAKFFLIHAVKGKALPCRHTTLTIAEENGALSERYRAIYSNS